MTNYLRDGEAWRRMKDGTLVKIGRDGEVVRDGERVTVPMTMMDSSGRDAKAQFTAALDAMRSVGIKPSKPTVADAAGHRPGFVVAVNSARDVAEAARIAAIKRMNDAWKPGQTEEAIARETTAIFNAQQRESMLPPAPGSKQDEAWERRNRRLANAWQEQA